MKDGFIKVAAATPKIRVADCEYNASEIIRLCREADALGVKILVFPELCVTGYTCGDLFLQDTLIDAAAEALTRIAKETAELDMLIARKWRSPTTGSFTSSAGLPPAARAGTAT